MVGTSYSDFERRCRRVTELFLCALLGSAGAAPFPGASSRCAHAWTRVGRTSAHPAPPHYWPPEFLASGRSSFRSHFSEPTRLHVVNKPPHRNVFRNPGV